MYFSSFAKSICEIVKSSLHQHENIIYVDKWILGKTGQSNKIVDKNLYFIITYTHVWSKLKMTLKKILNKHIVQQA